MFCWLHTLHGLIPPKHQGGICMITRKRDVDKWDEGNADLHWHKLALASTNRALIS